MRYVTNGKGELVVISRSGEIVITDDARPRARAPQGAVRRDC
jgi:DNA-directed RNA polymerase subunit beta'